MATMQNIYPREELRVIHPLDDIHEDKCSSEGLGPMLLTPSVKISLKVLRGYLMLMTAMLVYYVLDLGGILHSRP